MRKNLFSLYIFLIFSTSTSHAGAGELNDLWLLTRDHILDGILDPTKKDDEVKLVMQLNFHHNKISGGYTEINNDSIFTGETYTARGTTLIVLTQYDKSFYVIHNGHMVDQNHFVGTWFASGNLSGDFELKKQINEKHQITD